MPIGGNNLGTAHGAIKIDTGDLKNADIALRSAGGSMVNFGMQAVGAFAAIVSEAAKFEKEMDFVQAVTAASADEMQALQDKAIELGKESIFGPVALSQAFVELAKAGADVQDIIDGVGEASVQLATAADVEIPFAGENLINILNTFSLGAADAVRVADLLAGAANASSVELSDIVTTMRYAGPVAAAMGISIEEVNQALSVLGRVGIKGSTAGTSLRFAMTRLIPDTDKAKEAIADLGLNIDEATGSIVEFTNEDGSLKELADIFQILQERTKDLTDQQKIAVVNDIFGVRAMPSVLALMEAGTEGFTEMTDAINRTTAADVAAKRMDNLDGSIKRLKATLSAIMVDAGGPFQTMVKDWVDGLRNLLLAFDALPAPVKNFIVGGILAVGVLSLLAGGFLLTIGNIVRAVRVIGEITNAFALLAGPIGRAMKAMSLMNLALLASPWFWLVVAIVAVVAAFVILWMKSEAFREFWKELWDDIKQIAQDTWNWVKGAWDDIVEFFNDIEHAWQGLVNGFSGEGVTTSLQDITGWAERIGVALRTAYEWAKNFVGVGWGAVAGFFSEIGGAIGRTWSSIISGSKTAAKAIGSFFASLPSVAIRAFRSLQQTLRKFFFEQVPQAVGYALGFVTGRFLRVWYYEIPKLIFESGKLIITNLISWSGEVLGWAQRFGTELVLTIWTFISQLPGQFISVMTNVLAFLWSIVPEFTSWAWTTGEGVLNGLINFFSQIPGMVWGFITEAVSFLWGAVPNAVSAAVSLGEGVWNGIWNILSGLPDLVWGIFDRVVTAIKNMIGNATSAAKSFAGGIWDGFRNGLGINSPSFVERALMAIDDQSRDTLIGLRRTVQSMNRMTPSFSMTSGLGINGTSSAGNSQVNRNYYAPLIGQATIRSDQDIVALARELDQLENDRLAAAGRRIVR